MSKLRRVGEVRHALKQTISEALAESIHEVRVEISRLTWTNAGCSVNGTFQVIPFFTTRKGRFEADLDEQLGIRELRIIEEEE